MNQKTLLFFFFLLFPIYAQAGEGLSAWEKLGVGTIADDDMLPITDVSDTTQSVAGSSKTATAAQVSTYVGNKLIDDAPNDGNTTQAASSNWAYDHGAASDPHGGYVLESTATAPSAGLINLLGIGNGETTYSMKPLFDATAPSTQAFGDAAAVGSSTVSARRDHKHAIPANPVPSGTDGQILGYVGATPTPLTLGTIAGVTSTEIGYLDGVTSSIQGQINGIVGGSFAFDTYPTYEDSAHSGSGIAVNGTTLAVYSSTASKWLTVGLTDTLDPTPSAPTLSSRTIETNGTTLTLVGSASLSIGAGGNGGFDVDCVTGGNGITATYASGAPGSSLVYTLGSTVNSGDTCNLDYTQPGNGVEATTGGADLASITSAAITNSSTQGGATTETLNPSAATGGDNWVNAATVSSLTDSNDATLIKTYSIDTSQRYSFPAPTACSGTINKITLFTRFLKGGSSPVIDGYLVLNSYWGAANHYSSNHNFSGTVTEVSSDYATGPTGGKWTPAEIAANSFGVRNPAGTYSNGVSEAHVTKFWMVVTCD